MRNRFLPSLAITGLKALIVTDCTRLEREDNKCSPLWFLFLWLPFQLVFVLSGLFYQQFPIRQYISSNNAFIE